MIATEKMELIVRTARDGADRGGVVFANSAKAKKFLVRFQAAIDGDIEARGEFAGFDFAVIESAWIAGEDTGAIYFQ